MKTIQRRGVINKLIGNEIGDEGAKSMSETLKVNTTLTELFLSGEEEKNEEKGERNEKTRE